MYAPRYDEEDRDDDEEVFLVFMVGCSFLLPFALVVTVSDVYLVSVYSWQYLYHRIKLV